MKVYIVEFVRLLKGNRNLYISSFPQKGYKTFESAQKYIEFHKDFSRKITDMRYELINGGYCYIHEITIEE